MVNDMSSLKIGTDLFRNMNCFSQVMIKQECLRKSGYSVQADEEQLRYKVNGSLKMSSLA